MGCGASNKVQELDKSPPPAQDDEPVMRQKSLKCQNCGKNFLIPQMMTKQIDENAWCRKCIMLQAEIQSGGRAFNPNVEGNGFTPSWYDTGQPSTYVPEPFEALPDLTINLTYTKLEDTYDEKRKRQAEKKRRESEQKENEPKLVDKRDVLKRVNKVIHKDGAEDEVRTH